MWVAKRLLNGVDIESIEESLMVCLIRGLCDRSHAGKMLVTLGFRVKLETLTVKAEAVESEN